MTTPRTQIERELKEALKAGDRERLSVLRMLLADMKNESIRLGEELDEDTFTRIVRKGIKQRKDSVAQYEKGNRPELASKEAAEAEMLAAYLPEEVSEDELRREIRAIVEAQGLSGPAGIGPVMRTMMAKYGGSVDGSVVSRLAREILG